MQYSWKGFICLWSSWERAYNYSIHAQLHPLLLSLCCTIWIFNCMPLLPALWRSVGHPLPHNHCITASTHTVWLSEGIPHLPLKYSKAPDIWCCGKLLLVDIHALWSHPSHSKWGVTFGNVNLGMIFKLQFLQETKVSNFTSLVHVEQDVPCCYILNIMNAIIQL